jgi:hypothetical protein
MSQFDDRCVVVYNKEWRMEWSRKFFRAWLKDRQLQFISGLSLDLLSTLANAWIRKSVNSNQRYPIVSSQDIKEAAVEVLDCEKATLLEHKEIDRLEAIVREGKA